MLGAGDTKMELLLRFLGELREEKGKHSTVGAVMKTQGALGAQQQHLSQNGGIGKGVLETIPELNLKRYFKQVPRHEDATNLANCKE